MEGMLLLLLVIIFGPAVVGMVALAPWRRANREDRDHG
jgi:hypothetical protein